MVTQDSLPLDPRLRSVLFHKDKGYPLGFTQSGMGIVPFVVTLRAVQYWGLGSDHHCPKIQCRIELISSAWWVIQN